MGEFLRNDDKLFRDDLPDIANNAVLKYYFQQFSFYADGYRIAADNLIKTLSYEIKSYVVRTDVPVNTVCACTKPFSPGKPEM